MNKGGIAGNKSQNHKLVDNARGTSPQGWRGEALHELIWRSKRTDWRGRLCANGDS